MANEYFLGIDAGTTAIKVVIFSSIGNEIHIETAPNKVLTPKTGWSEQDMNELWLVTKQTIKKAIENSSIPASQIKAIGLTGQGEGCWLIDKDGEPCRNAILWNDTRAMPLINALSEKTSKLIRNYNGSIAGAGRTSILLAWLAQNEPNVLQRAKACFACKDWIRYKLTGEIAYEVTDASAGILDLETMKASAHIFSALDIDNAFLIIPSIISSTCIAGTITEEIAKECGLIAGTPVSGGFMDVVACPVGMGATNLGDVNIILGTACINGIVQKKFNSFTGYCGYTVSGDNKNYLCLIGSMAAMQNIDWVCHTLLAPYREQYSNEHDFFDFLDAKIESVSVGSGKIIYHPYIKNSGERAPFRNPNARASFWGISEETNLWELVRSVYEGVALSIKDCMQGHVPARIFLSGGGANSKQLRQIIADCLKCEVICQTVKEIGAKGAAISAAVASRYFDNITDATEAFHSDTIITKPQQVNFKIYEDLFNLYYNLRIQYDSPWNQRANI